MGVGTNIFMSKPEKYRALILMSGVLVLLLILAAGITNVQFKPGSPFSLSFEQPTPGANGTLGNGNWFLVLIRGFLILCAISVPIYVFINLLTPAGRRRLLKGLIQFMVLLVFLYLLASWAEKNSKQPLKQEVAQPTMDLTGGQIVTDGQGEAPVQEPPKASPWLDAGICLGLAFILAIMITVLAWGIYRASKAAAGDAMTRLADEAQEAIDALHSGQNIRDTVIRCYIQMTQVLAEERNVRREEAMTPHEFEQILLTKLKLPDTPVQRLTRLFEAVRYGDYHPGKREEMEAIDSLTAIAAACKSAKASS
jgi:hypothetical protein